MGLADEVMLWDLLALGLCPCVGLFEREREEVGLIGLIEGVRDGDDPTESDCDADGDWLGDSLREDEELAEGLTKPSLRVALCEGVTERDDPEESEAVADWLGEVLALGLCPPVGL